MHILSMLYHKSRLKCIYWYAIYLVICVRIDCTHSRSWVAYFTGCGTTRPGGGGGRPGVGPSLSGVPDFFDRNKILSGYDLSHYQVPHCIRVFFYFVWFVFIHHNFQFYFKLCIYCNILDINLS